MLLVGDLFELKSTKLNGVTTHKTPLSIITAEVNSELDNLSSFGVLKYRVAQKQWKVT